MDFTFFSKDYAHKLNLYSSVQHTARQSYYGAGKDPKAYGKTNDLTAIAGIQYSYNFNRLLFMPAVLTTGSEYVYNKLADKMLGSHRSIDQTVAIYSLIRVENRAIQHPARRPAGQKQFHRSYHFQPSYQPALQSLESHQPQSQLFGRLPGTSNL